MSYSQLHALKGHEGSVVACKFNPAGDLIASASTDRTAKVWSSESGAHKGDFSSHSMGISDVAWSHSGKYLCTASDDQTLKLWDAETGQVLKTLKGHTNYVFCCRFHPRDHLLASGSFDETLRLWDVRTGKCLRAIPAHSDPITSVDFVHDGTMIVSCSLDGLMRIWDTTTGHCIKTMYDNESPPLSSVRFSPNGKFILAGSLDSSVRLWDIGYTSDRGDGTAVAGASSSGAAEKGQKKEWPLKKFSGHENKQFCIFSAFCAPQPSRPPRIITGSEDGSIFVYDINNRSLWSRIPGRPEEEAEGPGHCDAVLGIDTHPTEDIIVSGGHEKDKTVRVWRANDR